MTSFKFNHLKAHLQIQPQWELELKHMDLGGTQFSPEHCPRACFLYSQHKDCEFFEHGDSILFHLRILRTWYCAQFSPKKKKKNIVEILVELNGMEFLSLSLSQFSLGTYHQSPRVF